MGRVARPHSLRTTDGTKHPVTTTQAVNPAILRQAPALVGGDVRRIRIVSYPQVDVLPERQS